MAMKVRYTVVDGEVLSELRGGVKRDYVPDPLGSTVALLDSTQTITDTFSYWPYGESAGRTGTTATPFQYVGTMGYYTDSSGRNYVRARHLDKSKGRWVTEDPIGYLSEEINFYSYVEDNPISFIDFFGLETSKDFKCPRKKGEGWTAGTPAQVVWWRQHAYCSRCVQECNTWCDKFDDTTGPEPKGCGDCKEDCFKRNRICNKSYKKPF